MSGALSPTRRAGRSQVTALRGITGSLKRRRSQCRRGAGTSAKPVEGAKCSVHRLRVWTACLHGLRGAEPRTLPTPLLPAHLLVPQHDPRPCGAARSAKGVERNAKWLWLWAPRLLVLALARS
eukprot:NODE_3610_length_764_cov_248.583921.p4 GENE.NODE_3610_length_764_cov_248.583921~~NODE_3610_length_764_cov_248.583921.p4  ORF type:complete len:123 (-),score=15.37 NODE_3610_length_764_cov_248.583921:269-637(-)